MMHLNVVEKVVKSPKQIEKFDKEMIASLD